MASQDEEYQFSELEGTDLYSSEETEKPVSQESGGSDLIKQGISVAIALVILIFVIYKIATTYFYTEKDMPVPSAITKQEAPIQTPAPVLPVAVAPSPSVLNELESKIKNLFDQQSTVTTNQIQQLQNNLSELKAAQVELLNKLNDLNTKMQDINTNLAKQIAPPPVKLAPVRPVAVVKPRPKIRSYYQSSREASREKFSLQAVIPGRAWLIAENGATITVSVGSSIPGYGQVRYIDAQKGRVVTSTGDVIKFDLSSDF